MSHPGAENGFVTVLCTSDPMLKSTGYPPDFFDFIVMNECHRCGTSDESNWRGIMEDLKPAVQMGPTATPRPEENRDTYRSRVCPSKRFVLNIAIS